MVSEVVQRLMEACFDSCLRHYFDAFHVATARMHGLPMITSDGYIIQRQADLGITAINLEDCEVTETSTTVKIIKG